MRKKLTYTSSKKFEVIKDLLRGDKTFEQVCIKHGLGKSTVSYWKKQFDRNGSMIFEITTPKRPKEEESPELLRDIIGKLTIENSILKKALSVWD